MPLEKPSSVNPNNPTTNPNPPDVQNLSTQQNNTTYIYQGKPVFVLRNAQPDDFGYDDGKDQIVIRTDDSVQKTVMRDEVTPSTGNWKMTGNPKDNEVKPSPGHREPSDPKPTQEDQRKGHAPKKDDNANVNQASKPYSPSVGSRA